MIALCVCCAGRRIAHAAGFLCGQRHGVDLSGMLRRGLIYVVRHRYHRPFHTIRCNRTGLRCPGVFAVSPLHCPCHFACRCCLSNLARLLKFGHEAGPAAII